MAQISIMTRPYNDEAIDDYFRKRLMPVEEAIPHLSGIEMYGSSIPVGTVGGDLFEYINFQQRYDIDSRIRRALKLSKQFVEPLPSDIMPGNSVDDHVEWLKAQLNYRPEMEIEYRDARSSEQVRIAEDLRDLCSTAGVLIVDAQGHGLISAKIASSVHDTFHALMLAELDRHGKTTPALFEQLNLRFAHSVSARNALGRSESGNPRETATLLYGEIHPYGYFRFVNFGHPPPLVFSAKYRKFSDIDKDRMVQFLALGLQIPEDDPDRNRYFSMQFRRRARSSDVAEINLMGPGDILFLYTDGVYDGSDDEERRDLESVLRDHYLRSAKDICEALLEHSARDDEHLRQSGEEDRIDDKTVLIIKRS
jgi:serine phosphatase RsbU (regulator of sigma subunit)